MCGGLQFGGDIARMSDSAAARVRYLNDVYKKIRHLLVQDFYPLTNQPQTPDDGEAVMFVNNEKTSAVIMAFSGIDSGATACCVRAKGLDAEMLYEATNLLADAGETCQATGSVLMGEGLNVRIDEGVALYAMEAT
jgi:hypothetical protein